MLQTVDVMRLAHKVKVAPHDAETAAKIRAVIADLTPDEVEFWRKLAPIIIDPERLREIDVVDYFVGPWPPGPS